MKRLQTEDGRTVSALSQEGRRDAQIAPEDGGGGEAVKRRDCSHGPAPVVDNGHQASRRAPTGRTRTLLRKLSTKRCYRFSTMISHKQCGASTMNGQLS